MSFPRYPKYKDSGVEWLGEVPEHWEVKRLKHNLRLLTEKTDRRENPVALENIEGWTGRFVSTDTEFQGEGIAFEAGDILFGKLRPYLAKAYLADSSGEAVGDFHVMRPRPESNGRFAQYQILNRDFIGAVDGSTFGSKMPRASWDFVGAMKVTTPPVAEQTTIATFLDRETSKIDELVAEQRRLMELLKEKRQAVISHAVTRGLNPDAPLKPSGIEWLGDVPEHWEILKVKHLARSIEQGWSPQCEGFPAESETEWGVLKVGCVNGGTFNPAENKLLPPELDAIPALSIASGDLLISRANTRELVGSAAVAERDHTNLMLCDKLYRLRFDANRCCSRFISFYLGSSVVRGRIELEATGASASMVNIGQSVIMDLVSAAPPLEEQRDIIAALDIELSKLDTLTAEAQRAIDLLQERRTALISAAVTGRIDVRGLAEPASERLQGEARVVSSRPKP
jgi:type I restriction enzyme S subunit